MGFRAGTASAPSVVATSSVATTARAALSSPQPDRRVVALVASNVRTRLVSLREPEVFGERAKNRIEAILLSVLV